MPKVLSYKNDTPVSNTTFDASRKTKVIVHGFSNSGFEGWVQRMKDAFLQIEDCNVIVVGWENGAKLPYYDQAVANTRLVGRQLRLVMERLVRVAGLDLMDVHVVRFRHQPPVFSSPVLRTYLCQKEQNLQSGAEYTGLVVAASEVGKLQSLTIRYNKARGWMWGLFGGGKDRITVDAVKVVSGENGKV
nr:hypothetical protein BaRGS_034146 [Batillaria attramentaria]